MAWGNRKVSLCKPPADSGATTFQSQLNCRSSVLEQGTYLHSTPGSHSTSFMATCGLCTSAEQRVLCCHKVVTACQAAAFCHWAATLPGGACLHNYVTFYWPLNWKFPSSSLCACLALGERRGGHCQVCFCAKQVLLARQEVNDVTLRMCKCLVLTDTGLRDK